VNASAVKQGPDQPRLGWQRVPDVQYIGKIILEVPASDA
jgi:hypothetical protein